MKSSDSVTGPINMGNPSEFTIAELAEKIIKLTSSKSKIISEPLPVDDPKQRRPDIDQAKKLLDWEPKVPVDEGLVKTIEYFDDLLGNMRDITCPLIHIPPSTELRTGLSRREKKKKYP